MLMQLQGSWHMSPSLTDQTAPRVPSSKPEDITQAVLLWKAAASALLHMQTASSVAVRSSHSIPRVPASTAKLPKGRDTSQTLCVPGVLDLGSSVIGGIAQCAAKEVHCWLHDAHAMICAGEPAASSAGFCNLRLQLCLPPAGAFQVG